MFSFIIRLFANYDYADLKITGYTNYGNNHNYHWFRPGAVITNSSFDSFTVTFGYDSDNSMWIMIPVMKQFNWI
jgi:hypothetical protein